MTFEKLVPNLVVRDVNASVEFYTKVLGFQLDAHVPEQRPFIFACVKSGNVEIFLNDHRAANIAEFQTKAGFAITLYLRVTGIDDVYERVRRHGAKIVMPMKTQFYGVKEFAFEDPDRWIIMPAEPVR